MYYKTNQAINDACLLSTSCLEKQTELLQYFQKPSMGALNEDFFFWMRTLKILLIITEDFTLKLVRKKVTINVMDM